MLTLMDKVDSVVFYQKKTPNISLKKRKKIKFLLNDPYNWILTNALLDHSLSVSGTSATFV